MDVDKILDSIEWLGHDAFRISYGGQIIYFDPFKLSPPGPAGDIILVTHEHFDHCSVEDIAGIKKEDTVIVTEPGAAQKLQGEVVVLKPGEQTTVKGITIEATPSYNIGKTFHPQANEWLGFIVTVGGCRIYHAGDTDHIPEMKDLKVDIALLPVSGTFVMTAEEAVQAALDIKPKVAIPMHYGDIVGEQTDADRFAEELQGQIRVEKKVQQQ
ncbi:MAG: MBL fold metallo-hydrolase [Desulfurivibrionaceae bacterium]